MATTGTSQEVKLTAEEFSKYLESDNPSVEYLRQVSNLRTLLKTKLSWDEDALTLVIQKTKPDRMFELVDFFLKEGADVDAHAGWNVLHELADRKLDRQTPEAKKDEVSHSYGSTMKLLLDRRVDPNKVTTSGETPLMLASASGNTVVAQLLLEAKAEVNFIQEVEGHTALGKATKRDMVELLLKHKADPEGHPTKPCRKPLRRATDCIPSMRLLLEAKANINARDQHSHSALDQCINLTSIAYLLGAKADPNLNVGYGNSLHQLIDTHIESFSEESTRSEIAKFLISMVSDQALQDCNKTGQTPLNQVIKFGHRTSTVEIVTALLQNPSVRQSINSPDNNKKTVLHNLLDNWSSSSAESSRLLLTQLFSIEEMENNLINSPDQNGETPFMLFASLSTFQDQEELLNEFLRRGVKWDAQSPYGNILHYANSKILNIILKEMKPDVTLDLIHQKNTSGITPLFRAVREAAFHGCDADKSEKINLLLAHGAQVTSPEDLEGKKYIEEATRSDGKKDPKLKKMIEDEIEVRRRECRLAFLGAVTHKRAATMRAYIESPLRERHLLQMVLEHSGDVDCSLRPSVS